MVATIVKTIGTTGDYTTLAAWQAAAPANLTTSERWTAGTFTGTFQAGETVTGTGLTAGKFLASNGSSYVAFGIVTGDSLTLTTLTGSTSGATCVVATKTDTGIIWQGQCQNQLFSTTTGSSSFVQMSGSTSSATCYKELTTVAGASFRDNAGVQTNPLRYDSTKGAAISDTGYQGIAVNLNENYARFSNLQVTGGNPYGLGVNSIATTDVNNCIIEGYTNAVAIISGTIRNSLLINRKASKTAVLSLQNGHAYSCTIVVPSNIAKASEGVYNNSYSTSSIQNCAIFGATLAILANHAGITVTNCYTDQASPPAGFTTVAYNTTTGSGFQNITDATQDYRLVSTSALINVGTTDSTNAAIDIAKTSRPSGAAYDIGAWEYVSAGGPNTYTAAASGGMIFGGAGSLSRTRAPVAAGGMVIGGAGAVSRTRVPVAAGGMVIGGGGALARTIIPVAAGGMVIGGAGFALKYDPGAPIIQHGTGGMIVNMGQLLSK